LTKSLPISQIIGALASTMEIHGAN